jgi:hypothetical protein
LGLAAPCLTISTDIVEQFFRVSFIYLTYLSKW